MNVLVVMEIARIHVLLIVVQLVMENVLDNVMVAA